MLHFIKCTVEYQSGRNNIIKVRYLHHYWKKKVVRLFRIDLVTKNTTNTKKYKGTPL